MRGEKREQEEGIERERKEEKKRKEIATQIMLQLTY